MAGCRKWVDSVGRFARTVSNNMFWALRNVKVVCVAYMWGSLWPAVVGKWKARSDES